MSSKHSFSESKSLFSKSYQLISDAAGLMRRCAGYIADEQAKKQDWQIYYATDADVIKRYRYSAVFEDIQDDQNIETQQLLSYLMAEFIFDHLNNVSNNVNGNSLFIISPHDEELGKMIFALSSALLNSIDEAVEDLDKLLFDLPIDEPDKISQYMIDKARTLLEIFDGKSGVRSELERFEALEENRLRHIENYKETSDWVFPLPRLNDESEDLPAFSQYYEDWKKRLLHDKSVSQPMYSVMNDAYVMTMLEWINQQMAEDKRRLVLITGTQSIINASADYRSPHIKNNSKTFGELYVRHPLAFIADKDFFPEVSTHFETGGIKKFKLLDWLNLFFPKVSRFEISGITSINTALLKRIENESDLEFQEAVMLLAKSELKADERDSFPNSMLLEWQTQIRNAAITHKISPTEESWPERAKELSVWLKNKLDHGWTVEQLRADLASRAIQSLSALYSSTVWLGLWGQVDPIKEFVRGIPALRFDSCYHPAQQYCRLLISAMKADSGTGKLDQTQHINIAEIYTQLSVVDKSNYHAHVIHALAYATKGHWQAAKTLCKIALRTIDELPVDDRNYRSGREAAYLLAISERRRARKIDDLVVAQRYLQEAKNRINPGEAEDLRFFSEAIAIDVAKINFEFFVDENTASLTELNILWHDASELINNLDSEPLTEIRIWINQQLSTNILNLALIYLCINRSLSETELKLVGLMLTDWQEKSLNKEYKEFRDSVSDFIHLIAEVVFGDVKRKSNAKIELETFQFTKSLPFDTKREALFRGLAENFAG